MVVVESEEETRKQGSKEIKIPEKARTLIVWVAVTRNLAEMALTTPPVRFGHVFAEQAGFAQGRELDSIKAQIALTSESEVSCFLVSRGMASQAS